MLFGSVFGQLLFWYVGVSYGFGRTAENNAGDERGTDLVDVEEEEGEETAR